MLFGDHMPPGIPLPAYQRDSNHFVLRRIIRTPAAKPLRQTTPAAPIKTYTYVGVVFAAFFGAGVTPDTTAGDGTPVVVKCTAAVGVFVGVPSAGAAVREGAAVMAGVGDAVAVCVGCVVCVA